MGLLSSRFVVGSATLGMTLGTILGMAAAVGTIDAGKLANLVVVSGNDLFASGTPIKYVFVEGRLY